MMNRYSSFLIAAVGCLGAHAQITLTAMDNVPAVPPPNSSFTYNKATYAAAPAGGADQVFDYSTLLVAGTTTVQWTDTTAYSNGGLFTGAQMMSVNGTDTVFYALTDAGLERVGEFKRLVVGQTIDMEITHSNNLLDLSLPLAYNDQWSDDVLGTVTSGADTGERNGIIQGSADAWGTILLPGVTGAVPVLRVFTNLQEIIQIPIGGNPADVTHKHKQYDYYAPFLKMPILSVYSDSLTYLFVNVADNGIRWMNTNPVGMAELASVPMEIGLAPNPASDNVVMTLDLPTEAGAILIISDATGRTIISERMPAATRRWDLETQALATGCYSVTVLDRNGSHGAARLIKQ